MGGGLLANRVLDNKKGPLGAWDERPIGPDFTSGPLRPPHEYKDLAHEISSKNSKLAFACCAQAVKTGLRARNCPHWASGSGASSLGQSVICPRIQVIWRLA